MEVLTAILKAVGVVLGSLIIAGLIVFGCYKKPTLTFILVIVALTIITAIRFYI